MGAEPMPREREVGAIHETSIALAFGICLSRTSLTVLIRVSSVLHSRRMAACSQNWVLLRP